MRASVVLLNPTGLKTRSLAVVRSSDSLGYRPTGMKLPLVGCHFLRREIQTGPNSTRQPTISAGTAWQSSTRRSPMLHLPRGRSCARKTLDVIFVGCFPTPAIRKSTHNPPRAKTQNRVRLNLISFLLGCRGRPIDSRLNQIAPQREQNVRRPGRKMNPCTSPCKIH
jgi:hypothetical protein